MIVKYYNIPLYRGRLVILITDKCEDVQKYIHNFIRTSLYAHSICNQFKEGAGYFMVLNFNSKYRTIRHGTITHEALHLSDMISFDRGLQADFNNDEPQAYLAEWITDKVYEVIKKHNLKVY